MTRRTRAERLAMPLARDVVKALAVEHGACIRPVQLRRTSLDTGTVDQVLVPCGHTQASVCPAEISRTEWIAPELGAQTFRQYAEQWMRDRVLKARTAELYNGLLTNHLFPDSVTSSRSRTASAAYSSDS